MGRFFRWLFGDGSSSSGAAALAHAVDALHTSEAEKGEIDARDADAARRFAAPLDPPACGVWNQLIDGFSRLIRPGITVWLVGGFMRWWQLPDSASVDPVWFQVFLVVIVFWFGGRMLVKELPAVVHAILALRSLRR